MTMLWRTPMTVTTDQLDGVNAALAFSVVGRSLLPADNTERDEVDDV